jgi:hypothetical protein
MEGWRMDWKSVLYEYVHRRNRMEADGGLGDLERFVDDGAYLDLQKERLERVSAHQKERGIKLHEQETAVRIAGLEEDGERIRAKVLLKRIIRYETANKIVTEEREEVEHIGFRRRSGRWMISALAPDRSDGRRIGAGYPLTAQSHEAATSLPYISPDIYSPVVPVRPSYYDGAKAAQYADRWWNSYNPQYLRFEVDCSNYVSQSLFAGGAPMNYTGKRGSGWWYRGKSGGQELWSYSWSVANALRSYLSSSRSGLRAEAVDSPRKLSLGDVISYSWDGSVYGHSTVVTDLTPDGMPLVNAHTVNSRHRYWDYRDSYAWTPKTRYLFFHINLS